MHRRYEYPPIYEYPACELSGGGNCCHYSSGFPGSACGLELARAKQVRMIAAAAVKTDQINASVLAQLGKG